MRFIIFFRKKYELLIIFFLSLCPILWFRNEEIILGHDSGLRLNISNYFTNLFYSYNPNVNFGVDWTIFKGFLIIQLPELLSQMVLPIQQAQIVTFIFWFFLMALAMYVFVYNFFPLSKHRYVRVFVPVFYVYNFFLLQGWFIAERAKFSLYAALPLALLVVYNVMNRKISVIKGGIIFSFIFFFLNGGGSPPLYGGIVLVMSLSFVFLTIVNILERGFGEVLYTVKVIVSFFLFFVLLNAYWIVPELYLLSHSYASSLGAAGGLEGVLSWERVISQYASFLNLFRLQGMPDWYDNGQHPYSYFFTKNTLLVALSFLPIMVILLGILSKQYLYKIRDRKLIGLTLLILLVGIFFSAGTHPPLGFIYEFLVLKVPGFAIFRSSYYKFGPAYFFAMVFLTGYFLQVFYDKFLFNKKQRIIFSIVTIGFILFYHFPFFTGTFFNFNKPFTTKVIVPAYVEESFDYLDSQGRKGAILLMPEVNKDSGADSYEWGFWSLDYLPRLDLERRIITSDANMSLVDSLYDAIENSDETTFDNTIRVLGITHILWRDDVLNSTKINQKKHDLELEQKLLEFSSVSLEKKFGKWKVYEVSLNSVEPFSVFSNIRKINSSKDISGLLPISPNIPYVQEYTNTSALDSITISDMEIADCVLCDSLSFMDGFSQMPSVRFLPWSRFYFITQYREKKMVDKQNTVEGKIDVLLSLSKVRLAEIRRMLHVDFNQNAHIYVSKNVSLYKDYIKQIEDLLHGLPDERKNEYGARIYAFISSDKNYVADVAEGMESEKTINELEVFLDKFINRIKKTYWISESLNHRMYLLSLDKPGSYSLVEDVENSAIKYEEQQLQEGQFVNFGIGENRIHVIDQNFMYVLGDENTKDEKFELNLRNGLAYFNIKIPNKDRKYVLHFNYSLESEDDARMMISNIPKNDDRFSQELIAGSMDKKFERIIEVGDELLNIEFEGKGRLQLSNFYVAEYYNDSLVFMSPESPFNSSQPSINVEERNPTDYIIKIRNSHMPFLLQFNQRKNANWKLYEVSDSNILFPLFSSSLPLDNQVLVNGYANGWVVDKKGDFSLRLVFFPQVAFYFGLAVSTICFLLYIVILKFKNEKK